MPNGGTSLLDWQLSARARREIAQHWPNLQADGLVTAAKLFRLDMSIQEERGNAQWAEEMSRLAKTSRAFLAELENARWSYMTFGHVKFGGRTMWFHEHVTKLIRVFVNRVTRYRESAEREDGRKVHGPRTNFILTIRRQLESAGYGLSARPNDDLVRVLDLLFHETGYPASDTRKTVAHALKGAGIDV